jgi:hypothetical protein
MELRERLHRETRLYIRISRAATRSCYNTPCSANLASAEAPADLAWLYSCDTASSSMMDGMAGHIASRNSAVYRNQHATVDCRYNTPYSANLASAEAPDDRASL